MKFRNYLGLAIASIEWYEAAICVSLAPVLSAIFFPQLSAFTSFMLYFSSFAAGYFGRPLGAFLFGTYSDTNSRLKATYFSLCMMIASSICISFLPTYITIGIAAPILFSLLKFIQGIALGGNYGVSVFSVENAHKNERYFAASMISVGFMIGFLLGGLIVTIFTQIFSQQFLYSIGWRIAIWISFIISIPVLIQMRNLVKAEKLTKQKKIKEVSFENNQDIDYKLVAKISCILLLDMVPFYMFFVFLPNYKIMFLNMSSTVWLEQSLSMFVMMVFTPFFGKVADAYGAVRTLKISAIVFAILSLFIPWKSFLWNIAFGFSMAICYGCLYGFVSLAFPKNIRARTSSIIYNVMAIFGAFTPMIATALARIHIALTGCFLGLVSIAVFIVLTKTKDFEN